MNKEESDDFEIMVTRIHEILEREGAVVEWNEKIPDPENPKQLRQIDVSVRYGELFTIIECRLQKDKQNVQWIEELIGRRASLCADSIIAVSSSGFTSGAIKKAKKYSIVLKDLVNLSDDEITQWIKSVNISILFYKHEELVVKLFLDNYNELNELDLFKIKNELVQYHYCPEKSK